MHSVNLVTAARQRTVDWTRPAPRRDLDRRHSTKHFMIRVGRVVFRCPQVSVPRLDDLRTRLGSVVHRRQEGSRKESVLVHQSVSNNQPFLLGCKACSTTLQKTIGHPSAIHRGHQRPLCALTTQHVWYQRFNHANSQKCFLKNTPPHHCTGWITPHLATLRHTTTAHQVATSCNKLSI